MRIGVFDSGLGGLTVVQAIIENLKGVEITYLADTKFAPYGEKTKEQILKHSFHITKYLIDEFKIDALVVACNTATSAAIKELRAEFNSIIVVGTEPGLKPAINKSVSKKIGVMATQATLMGTKYQLLLEQLSSNSEIKVYEQACSGLVQKIEEGKIKDDETFSMLHNWLTPMKEEGVDTIVLGCTHYPLIKDLIKQIMGDDIYLIETGNAIAKRVEDLRIKQNLKNENFENRIKIFYTDKINFQMVELMLKDYVDGGKIIIKDRDE